MRIHFFTPPMFFISMALSTKFEEKRAYFPLSPKDQLF